jgi:hypothetical protein
MKKIFAFFILTLFAVGSCFAQINFQRVYAGDNYDFGQAVKQTYDTCYIITGTTSSFGDQSSNVYLLKIDSLGECLWSKSIGGNHIDWGMDIVQTYDSGYAIAGYTNSFGNGGYDVYLVKTDKDGNTLWTQTYGGTDWDFGYSIQQMPDSGFVIAGETYSYGNGNNDGFLLRTDKTGDSLWMNTYGGIGDDIIHKVIPTYNDRLVMIGSSTSYSLDGSEDVYFVRVDAMGNTLLDTVYGGVGEQYAKSVVELGDQHYTFLGTSTTLGVGLHDIWLVKIDSLGNVFWQQTYGDVGEDYGYDLVMNPFNGGMYLAAATNSYGLGKLDGQHYVTTWDGFYFTGDTDGTIEDDDFKDIEFCFDKGAIMVGSTQGDVGYGQSSVFVVKFDENLYSLDSIVACHDVTSIYEEPQFEGKVSVYPNPTSDLLTITINLDQITSKRFELVIYNLVGERVKQISFKGLQTTVSVGDLAKGLYQYHLKREGEPVATGKVVVSR